MFCEEANWGGPHVTLLSDSGGPSPPRRQDHPSRPLALAIAGTGCWKPGQPQGWRWRGLSPPPLLSSPLGGSHGARRLVEASSGTPLQSSISFAGSSAPMARSSGAQGGRPSVAMCLGGSWSCLWRRRWPAPMLREAASSGGAVPLDMRGGGNVGQGTTVALAGPARAWIWCSEG